MRGRKFLSPSEALFPKLEASKQLLGKIHLLLETVGVLFVEIMFWFVLFCCFGGKSDRCFDNPIKTCLLYRWLGFCSLFKFLLLNLLENNCSLDLSCDVFFLLWYIRVFLGDCATLPAIRNSVCRLLFSKTSLEKEASSTLCVWSWHLLTLLCQGEHLSFFLVAQQTSELLSHV